MLLPALCAGLAAGAAPAIDSNACLVCHNNEHFVVRLGNGRLRSLFVDPERFYKSVHAAKGCGACHRGLALGPHPQTQSEPLAPELQAMLTPRSGPQRVASAECMRCHPDEARRFATSVHGQHAANGNLDVPLCDDCHGHHYIDRRDDLESSVNPENVPGTCAKCHSNQLVMARYDLNTSVVTTYEASFHGEKRALGSGRAAVCTSCHGVHDIRAPQDPLSSVNPANAPDTCGRCHDGADAAFARSFRHQAMTPQRSPVVFWVSTLYKLLIAVTVGGMLLYMVLDAAKRRRLRGRGDVHE